MRAQHVEIRYTRWGPNMGNPTKKKKRKGAEIIRENHRIIFIWLTDFLCYWLLYRQWLLASRRQKDMKLAVITNFDISASSMQVSQDTRHFSIQHPSFSRHKLASFISTHSNSNSKVKTSIKEKLAESLTDRQKEQLIFTIGWYCYH